ncbi:MAG: LysM peptidoglycan-binding domain-containing protein [Desulfobacterales bacterium]|nr:LysM peptidoglycan-binding domain-containing protein [Desulfobacterales bacterium]
MAALEERMKGNATPDRPRTRLLAFAGLLVFLAILLVSVLYTCSENRDLAKRVDRLEERFKMVPAPTMDLEQVRSQLTSLEESLVGLTDLAQENHSAAKSLAGKIQTIEEKMAQIESRPASKTPASAKEKAEPAPLQQTTAKDDGSGRVHVVQKGENLFRISVKYKVALDQLAKVNDMKVNDPIYPGQKIKLP